MKVSLERIPLLHKLYGIMNIVYLKTEKYTVKQLERVRHQGTFYAGISAKTLVKQNAFNVRVISSL